MRVTQPFDASTLLSIDPELGRRVDLAQGHELAEWQMGVFRQPLNQTLEKVDGTMEFSLYFVSEDKARRSSEVLGKYGFELQKLGWSRANDSYYVVVRKPVQPEEAEPLLRTVCKRFGGVYKDYFSETGQIIKPK